MKKIAIALLAGLLCLPTLTACSTEAQSITLYTWEGMFPDEVLAGFTEETGIEINYATFDLDETMLAKLEATDGADYDLVIADDYIIETVIAEGLAQELDTSLISNIDNVNEVFQGQFYDPDDAYTVPYGAGIITIVYDDTLVDIEIDSYEDLWDESLADSVGVVGNARVVNGIALKVLGESYNTTDTAVLEEASELLNGLASNIRLIKDSNLQDDLLSGEISVGVMYSSQAFIASFSNPDLTCVFPEEGLGFGIMAQFIPSNASNVEGAHAFIDYILDPEISAMCYEWLGYYCTNEAAEDYINPDYAPYLVLSDDVDTSNTEMIENIDSATSDIHTEMFTEFSANCQ